MIQVLLIIDTGLIVKYDIPLLMIYLLKQQQYL